MNKKDSEEKKGERRESESRDACHINNWPPASISCSGGDNAARQMEGIKTDDGCPLSNRPCASLLTLSAHRLFFALIFFKLIFYVFFQFLLFFFVFNSFFCVYFCCS